MPNPSSAGRTMISVPTNPAATTPIRGRSTRSPSTATAMITTKIGMVNCSAESSASVTMVTPKNHATLPV